MLSNYNFNLNPYYDDFDERKEFYRILFKPGFAVQARELTQLQTQLQNQIAKFGSHIFKEGSVVLNGNFFNYDVSYILISRDNNVENFIDQTFTGQTSGAKGKVVKTEFVNDTTTKLYFSYTNGLFFEQDETIVCDNTTTETILDNAEFSGTATAFSIDEGVFFVNGHFVYCNPQTIIISEDEPATCRVGLVATESIVTSNQDTSLLDPSFGSYNYAAPGADRYAISLDLLSVPFDPSIDDAEENSSDKFIELSRFVNGEQISVSRVPIYSEIEDTLARRTFDESGDYTVRAFGIKVKEHLYGNTDLLTLQIDAGKAYVKGYEFETTSPTFLDIEKSRTTLEEDEFPVFVNYGNYLLVQNISGDLDYTGNRVVSLRNDITNSNAAIGNAVVKYIEFDSRISGNNIYKMYVDSVNIFDPANNAISNIRSVTSTNYQANVSTSLYSSGVNIQGNDNSTYILKIPKEYVNTLLLDGSDTSYTTIKKQTNAEFTSNGTVAQATVSNPTVGQIFLGSGTLSESDTRSLFLLTVATSANSTALPVGTVLDYSTHQLRVTIVDNDTVTFQTNTAVNFTTTVYSKISVSNALQKSKTLVSQTLSISGASLTSSNLSSKISLGVADCVELLSVVATSNTSDQFDYTTSYALDTGQTDVMYDHGSIQLISNKVDPITDSGANIVSMNVTFTYYTHSSTAGFFSVDSYPNYDTIPKFTSSTGEVFDLTNCLDFRPRRADASTTIEGTLLATPSSTLFCDFDYYIGRIDRLVLTKERKFNIIKGIPSINPAVPVDIVDGMTLYIINIPPYTKTAEDITHTFIEHKRYTMRDIGKIEKRVERMEFYTALSLLEKQAKDESIPSDIPTIDRFKNGILVDSFAGHSVGDVSNPDYSCSIDYVNRYMRPRFSSDSYTFKFNSGTNHRKSGDLITLNYTTETFVNQPLFSRTVNLNPYLVFDWNGVVDLSPSSDNWVDTHVRPDVNVNLNGENDVYTVLANNVNNPASSGVRWSDWQTVVNGVPQVTNQISTSSAVSTQQSGNRVLQTTTSTSVNNQTTVITDQLARVGVEIKTGAVQTVTRDLGTKIVDVSIVPFIRSRVIDYAGKLLKPSTQLIASFDGVDISKYCFPAVEIVLASGNTVNQNAESIRLSTNSSVTGRIIMKKRDRIFVRESGGSFGTGNTINWVVNGSVVGTGTAVVSRVERPISVRTNERGDVAGSFLIPSNTFRTGERLFRLSDVVGDGASTAASTKYVAQGLSQSTEKTLVSTRVSTVSINPVLDTRSTTSTTTRTTVSTNSTTVDITPPPPPPPPPPPIIRCANTERGGKQGSFEYTIEFGSNTGICGVTYDAFSTIPDRFTIIWDGNEYSTGFVGGTGYNSELRALGFPEVSGVRTGQLTFNKTKSQPTQAILRIDAPFRGTAWTYKVICPGDTITPPAAITTPSVELVVSPPATYTFNDTRVRNTAPLVPAEPQNITVKLDVNAAGTSAIYARVTGLTAVRTDTNESLTISPTTVDLIVGDRSRRARDSSTTTLTLVRPVDTDKPYDVTITGTVTLFTDSSRTISSGLVDSSTASMTVLLSPNIRVTDPVAQTFFVDARQYPNGIFLDSIDLFFKKKSLTLPATIELRPTVNGYPSSKDIVPFSVVTKEPEDIIITDDASVATNFKFPCPIYLPPGEHCFIARCDTTDYEIYTAVLGDTLLTDPELRITEQPAVGSMFKSQNLSTWTPVQEEDVMFRITKCVFPTGTANAASVVLHSDFPASGNVSYDVLFADGEHLDFAATNIDYFYKTTNLSGVTDSSFTQYQLGSNVTMPSRRVIRSGTGSDLQFNIVMRTDDSDISPVIDLGRFSTVVVENIINNAGLKASNFNITNPGLGYTSNANVIISAATGSGAEAKAVFNSNTGRLEIVVTNEGSGYTGNVSAVILRDETATANAEVSVQNEIGNIGGNAVARYITRRVTLAPNFESTDLKAYLLANIPTGTQIKVYYKVTPTASTFFESEPWREMVVESAGAFTETGFTDYKYKTIGDTALPSGDRFKTFTIKIVMLSSNPVRVPIVRDLRVIALDE
jgi:hypothetical protein